MLTLPSYLYGGDVILYFVPCVGSRPLLRIYQLQIQILARHVTTTALLGGRVLQLNSQDIKTTMRWRPTSTGIYEGYLGKILATTNISFIRI